MTFSTNYPNAMKEEIGSRLYLYLCTFHLRLFVIETGRDIASDIHSSGTGVLDENTGFCAKKRVQDFNYLTLGDSEAGTCASRAEPASNSIRRAHAIIFFLNDADRATV
jgi:hypothetical protein